MKTYKIALYPGDGIGREVIEEAARALRAVADADDFDLEMTQFPWGVDYHEREGVVVPPDYLEVLRPFDAVLLGAVGYPERLPDHITLEPLVRIRQRFDQYACVRPVKLYPGVRSPLRDPDSIDMVVLRENSEGEYLPIGGRYRAGESDEVAIQTAVHSRRGIERILRFGFDMARKRRHHLTMVTKSNALRYGYVLWDEVLEGLRGEFADVEAQRLHADVAAMEFVRRPAGFDVVVASNLFGDLLTDLSAVICGGLGLAPSANINPERTFPCLFEPVHGSAPDIVGKGIANPAAAVLSAAMMLEWLGEERAGAALRAAVESALADGCHTPDLGGSMTTGQMADSVVERLG